jgi:hypothetical protein
MNHEHSCPAGRLAFILKQLRLPLLILLAVHAAGELAAAQFRSAIAVRVVSPEPLLPVSGGVGASHETSKKLGELTVRALVLEEGATRVAIVSSDFLGFPSVLGNRVRKKVTSIPAQNILIGATHTHSAPDCYGFPDEQGKVTADLKYLDFVCEKMAEAINEAVEHLQPSRLRIATGEAKGKIAYNYYAPQLYDPRCHVLQTLGENGKPIATLVNYAIHPEVIGASQGILSPDLIGPLCDEIASKIGGTAIFMNSAQGGMVTADCRGPNGKDLRTWDECLRIGQLLANEALRIISPAAIQAEPVLFCTNRTITFSVESAELKQVMKYSPLSLGNGDSVSTSLNLVNIGNAQILTIPGEALPNIGFYLKRKMRGEQDNNLLFGLTNDAFGYILTKVDWHSFKRYDYVSRVSLGEMTGEKLIESSLELVEASPAPGKN